MDEIELISQLKTGDSFAFKFLVGQFGDRIYNTSLSILQNKEDAEDVTQEIFLIIFKSIHGFKGESKLSTWIYRITVTKSLEFLRKKNRKKQFTFIGNLFASESFHDNSDFNHPGVQLENKELSSILFSAINKLSENQKAAFLLHKVERLSYSEIADILKVSISSVESLMVRAKQNLQKLLGDYYNNIEKNDLKTRKSNL